MEKQRSIRIKNLPNECSESDLRKIFTLDVGEIEKVVCGLGGEAIIQFVDYEEDQMEIALSYDGFEIEDDFDKY